MAILLAFLPTAFRGWRAGAVQRVKEVAAKLGISDAYYFSRMLHRHMGASPASYRLGAGPEAS